MRKTAVIATSALALTVAGALIPTQASAAKVKFGAALNSTVKPMHSPTPLRCDWFDLTTPCSFVQNVALGREAGGEVAPASGTLKKVRVIAGAPGTFTLQLVKNKVIDGVNQARVKATGPTLTYHGQTESNWDYDTYTTETFLVNMPIKAGWRLAMKAPSSSAMQCPGPGSQTIVYRPALVAGEGFRPAIGTMPCYPLIEGVIQY